jgi:hypothetical protein
MDEKRRLWARAGQAALRVLGRLAFGIAWLWVIGAAWYAGLPRPLGPFLAAALAVGFPLAWFRTDRRRVAWVFVATAALAGGLWTWKQPRTRAHWAADLAHDPVLSWEGDTVTIDGVRDCRYRTPDDIDVRYRIETLDVTTIRTLDLVVERFHALDALAHTLLTFGFEDGRHIAISVEVRREEGEAFHPIAGLFREFELVYVIGTEEDLIGLRTNVRPSSQVWLYPIRTTPARMQALFVAMLRRAEHLTRAPEFYNTLTSTCTTNLVDHVVQLVPGRLGWDWRMVLPGYAAAWAYERGLIDTTLPFEEAQVRYRIEERARAAPPDADFSRRIRTWSPR